MPVLHGRVREVDVRGSAADKFRKFSRRPVNRNSGLRSVGGRDVIEVLLGSDVDRPGPLDRRQQGLVDQPPGQTWSRCYNALETVMDSSVKIMIDRGRLVENIDRLQIDREYLEDCGGGSLL